MADRIFGAQVPATPQADADTHGWGMRFTVSSNRDAIGGRAWVHTTGRPVTFFWQLWRVSGSALLATVNLNTLPLPTPGTWMSFTSADFAVPGNVALLSTETYIVNVFFQIGDGVFTSPGAFPLGVGVVSSDSGIFNNGLAQGAIPATAFAAYFFADVEVDAATATGSLDIVLPALGAQFDAEATAAGSLDAGMPALIAEFTGDLSASGQLDVSLPILIVDAVGLVAAGGALDIVLPALQISMTGVSAAGGATVGPCGWTIPDPLCCDEWASLDPAIQSSARDYAAIILWAATARQFGLCEITVRPCGVKRCSDGMFDFFGWNWSGGSWIPYIFNGTWFNCACPGICSCDPRCQIRLMGPVESITEVLLGGIAVDPTTYRVDDNHWLVRTNGECWPTCVDMDNDTGDSVLEVTYIRGSGVPPALLRAAATLACEWGKACTGADCRLSNRVTSIARQGVSIEMASPEAFMDDGMTGLWEVDSVISALNPFKRKQRARIWSPELNVPRTVTSP